jgi:hypothetical protein
MEESSTRIPSSKSKKKVQETFVSYHGEMREDGKTGAVEILGEGTEGGAVFLNGVVIYARYGEKTADDALRSLLSCDSSPVRVSSSTAEAVKMFRTYMRYISDDAVMATEPLDGTAIDSYEVDDVIVGGIKNTAGGSWGDEDKVVPTGSWTRNSPGAEMPPRSLFPEGRRTALAADTESLRRHVSEERVTGYAAGDGEVITFSDGEFADRKRVDVRRSIRADVDAGGGWVVVNTDPKTDDEKGGENGDGDESGGLLNRLF